MFNKIKITILKMKARFYEYKLKQCIKRKKKCLFKMNYRASYEWREQAAKYDVKRHDILNKISEIGL